MATFAASSLIDRAALALSDTDNVRWPRDELLEHLSDALRACVLKRPESNPVTVTVPLVAGTKQSLPEDAFVLIDSTRNMGWGTAATDATVTPGRAIRPTERSSLDAAYPDWHTEQPYTFATWRARSFLYDIRNRRTYYVQPGVTPAPTEAPEPDETDYRGASRYIEVVYAKIPDELAAEADTIPLDDIYEPPLLAYMLHRAYGKSSPGKEREYAEMAQLHFGRFINLLTDDAERQDADLTIRHETVESGRTPK